jgi:uncharacterized membrane protein
MIVEKFGMGSPATKQLQWGRAVGMVVSNILVFLAFLVLCVGVFLTEGFSKLGCVGGMGITVWLIFTNYRRGYERLLLGPSARTLLTVL